MSKLLTKIESLDKSDIQKLSPNEGSMLFKAKEDTLGLMTAPSGKPDKPQNDTEKPQNNTERESSDTNVTTKDEAVTTTSENNDKGDEFFYVFNLNGKVISVCYGVLSDNHLHYALLFDKKEADSLKMFEVDLKKCVMYFIDKVLKDTSRRCRVITKDSDRRIQVEFQIDLSGQFPLLTEYSFMSHNLGLRDKKNAGDSARIFDTVV